MFNSFLQDPCIKVKVGSRCPAEKASKFNYVATFPFSGNYCKELPVHLRVELYAIHSDYSLLSSELFNTNKERVTMYFPMRSDIWWWDHLLSKIGYNHREKNTLEPKAECYANDKVKSPPHCWKYFSPRSNFETKNPKLGSDNPFVLSVNFKNHLDLVCQFLDWQWSKLLDKGSNHRIPNSKYMTIVALIQ